jgi:uncharacterized protein YceH (UPF0502 family)
MLPVVDLDPQEVRVLGCLVEKQLSTPQQYPLTLNALVSACNQSSNRDPVVSFSEEAVERAVTGAKAKGLVRFVHPSHGRSALRYRHELAEQLGLDERQLALLAVLMLRGPQTPGELRSRTERMARLDGLGEVEAELGALAGREEPLVRRLTRSPGQKEDRYTHCLGSPGRAELDVGSRAGEEWSPSGTEVPSAAPGTEVPAAGAWSEELAELRAEVARLRRDLDELRSQLGA